MAPTRPESETLLLWWQQALPPRRRGGWMVLVDHRAFSRPRRGPAGERGHHRPFRLNFSAVGRGLSVAGPAASVSGDRGVHRRGPAGAGPHSWGRQRMVTTDQVGTAPLSSRCQIWGDGAHQPIAALVSQLPTSDRVTAAAALTWRMR